MKHYLPVLFICFFYVQYGQAQDIQSAYEALKAKAETVDATQQQDYKYFLDIASPFYKVSTQDAANLMPDYLLELYNYKSLEGADAFLNYNYSLVYDLYDAMSRRIRLKDALLYNIEEAEQDATLKTSAYFLKYQQEWDELAEAIIDTYEDKIKLNLSENVLAEIKSTRELYDKKYAYGYRNRNILEYFVNGGVAALRDKRRLKKTGNLGLILPPARGELILLANPIMSVASPSLAGFQENNSSVYLMVQVVGFDYHLKNFNGFWGVSVFHASPVNVDLELFKHPLFGIEAHYNNSFNLGFGLEYNALNNMAKQENYAAKIFISVALYEEWTKRKNAFQ